MKAGRPSLTARSVALSRSRLNRPQTPEGDPEAELRLYQGLRPRPPLSLVLGWGIPTRDRTQFVDEEVLQAIAQGVVQVVIVGAGYDGRPLRFRKPGVRFFEIDHPATQADKRRRVELAGGAVDYVTFIAADLTHDNLETVLAAAGHNPALPSLFICEGVLVYLPAKAVERLLTGLRAGAAMGSRLVLSAVERDSNPNVRDWMRQAILAAIGEPRRSRFGLGEIDQLLTGSSWTVVREISQARDGRRRLLVAAEPV